MCPPSFKQKGIGIKIPIPKNPIIFFVFFSFPSKNNQLMKETQIERGRMYV